MKKILFLSLGAFLGISLVGCTSNTVEEPQAETNEKAQFYGVTIPMEYDGDSRVQFNPNTRKYSWEVGDVVGVFATSGPQQSQVEYVVEETEKDESGNDVAKFKEGSYFNRPGYVFVSYYPLQEEYLRYDSDIAFSLSEQKQIANNDASELSKKLFWVTDPTPPESSTRFYFQYRCFWAVAAMYLTMPDEGTWTKVTIKAPAGCSFHENIKYNFAKAGGAGITFADNANSISMTLGPDGEGIHTAAGGRLDLFMLVCPTDMAGKDLIIEVEGGDRIYSCTKSGAGKSFFTSNTIYGITETMQFSKLAEDIRGTGHGFQSAN